MKERGDELYDDREHTMVEVNMTIRYCKGETSSATYHIPVGNMWISGTHLDPSPAQIALGDSCADDRTHCATCSEGERVGHDGRSTFTLLVHVLKTNFQIRNQVQESADIRRRIVRCVKTDSQSASNGSYGRASHHSGEEPCDHNCLQIRCGRGGGRKTDEDKHRQKH